ncbi:MAG: hypothetical protein Q9P01_13360 [Anaerolineae bacterium]|nr:hypothetical protein [Anaerolineae bacterium]
MTLFMGIDGGGSNLRVAIVDEKMQIQVITRRGTANPSIIGRDSATSLIHSAMREALSHIDESVCAVGDWYRRGISSLCTGLVT